MEILRLIHDSQTLIYKKKLNSQHACGVTIHMARRLIVLYCAGVVEWGFTHVKSVAEKPHPCSGLRRRAGRALGGVA